MKSIPYSPYEPSYKYGFDVEREDWIPIRPRRYVYHLDYSKGRKRKNDMEYYKYKGLSITLNGLFGRGQGTQGGKITNKDYAEHTNFGYHKSVCGELNPVQVLFMSVN